MSAKGRKSMQNKAARNKYKLEITVAGGNRLNVFKGISHGHLGNNNLQGFRKEQKVIDRSALLIQ